MNDLRQRLESAPRWSLMVLTGVPFGALVVAAAASKHREWTSALAVGVGSGLAYGVLTGLVLDWRFRRRRTLIGDVPAAEVRRAIRGAGWGKVPGSPDARAAAARVLTAKMAQEHRMRHWGAAVLVLFMGLTVFEALTDSPRWWPALLLWIAGIPVHYLAPRRFQRRIELLRRG